MESKLAYRPTIVHDYTLNNICVQWKHSISKFKILLSFPGGVISVSLTHKGQCRDCRVLFFCSTDKLTRTILMTLSAKPWTNNNILQLPISCNVYVPEIIKVDWQCTKSFSGHSVCLIHGKDASRCEALGLQLYASQYVAYCQATASLVRDRPCHIISWHALTVKTLTVPAGVIYLSLLA